MFHEVLLCLSGLPNKLEEKISNITELENIIHPCELKLLEQIFIISKDYKFLKDFIDTNLNRENLSENFSNLQVDVSAENDSTGVEDNFKFETGLYMSAFSEGLYKALAPYRNDLSDIEKQFLNESELISILSILHIVQKHQALHKAMVNLITEMKKSRTRGCQILSVIYPHTITGFGAMKKATIGISHLCHKIFIKQLKSWLFYGSLIDPHEEFFIQAIKEMPEEDKSNVSNYTAMTMGTMMTEGCLRTTNGENLKEYEIVLDLLPSYVTIRLANQILFIGDTILMLSHDSESRCSTNHGNFFEDKEDDLKKELDSTLDNERFDEIELESIVDTLKFCVTKYLWNLVIHKSDLFSHLKYMKDFYLIGWGELFVEFLSKSGSKLQAKVTKSFAAKNLNLALLQSSRALMNADERVIDKFNFTVNKNPNDILINQLFLNYKPDWPLQLIFTQPIIENYNAVFKFLLRLKKTQLDLHRIWLKDTKMKSSRLQESWKLRHRLMFLIDNLQYYLQVDVLESEYVTLFNSIKNSNDFDQISHAHIKFQANIMSKAFIYRCQTKSSDEFVQGQNPLSTQVHPVNNLLLTIFDICDLFCANHTQKDKIQSLDEEFNKTVKDLILLMSELRRLKSSYTELEQFLLRLDFNRWYTHELSNQS